MKDDKNHMNYSTEYLRKYLNGELTGQEMQALEKAALENPFLSDAIDGLQEAAKHSSSFESDVADLQRRIHKRVSEKKKKRSIIYMFPRWQVAASIVVIAAMTTLTITLIKNNSNQHPVSLVNKKDTRQMPVQPAPAVVQSASDTIELEKKTTVQAPAALKIEQDKSIVANTHRAPASIADNEEVKKKDTLHYVQGIVQDDSGKAIASATVRMAGQDKAVATDSNGYFKLYLNKNKKEQEIAINSVGFKTVNANVAPDSSLLKFQMQNAPGQLNEVVVTGYGAQKKRDITGSVTTVTSKAPQARGWQSLNNYINENKKINNTDSLLKGEEIISFVVNKKGKLSSFKVVKSISSSHDAEVIRLIKSGPPLSPVNGKKQTCQISIFFN